jgi:hypothetical protein
MRRTGSRRNLLALVAIAVLALSPAAADAKKKHKKRAAPLAVVTASATATSSTDGSPLAATATCPAGTTALGGGFSAPTDLDDFEFIERESVRTTTGWRVGGNAKLGAGKSISLTVDAYCARVGGTISEARGSSSYSPGPSSSFNSTTVTAECPAGSSLVSGGFSYDKFLAFYTSVFSNHAAGNAWTATLVRTDDVGTLTTSAYCFTPFPAKHKKKKGKKAEVAKHKKGKKKRPGARPKPLATVSASYAPTVLNQSVSTAPCPAGLQPVSGGWEAPTPTPMGSTFDPRIYTARFANGAWSLSVAKLTGSPGQISAFEYCA